MNLLDGAALRELLALVGAGWRGLALLGVAFVWAVVLANIGALASWRWWTAAAPRAAPADAPLRVLLVRPCAGADPWLARALRSTGALRHQHQVRVRFTVASAADPAWPLAQEIAAELRAQGHDANARVVEPRGPNHKVGQLAGLLAREADDADVLVNVDSDVDLHDVELDALLDPLVGEPWPLRRAEAHASGRVAVTWMPPLEREPPRTRGDRASAALLGGSLHAFPLLAGLDPAGMCGKLFAVRIDVLRRVGGMGPLAWYLGEDMELARRVAAVGGRVRAVPRPVASLAAGRSFTAARDRYARWVTVIRAQRPLKLLAYPLMFAALPLQLALVAAGVALEPRAWELGLTLAAAVLGPRLLVAWCAAAAGRRPPAPLTDVMWAELLLWAAFVRALTQRTVVWRGRPLHIDREGVLHGPGELHERTSPAGPPPERRAAVG